MSRTKEYYGEQYEETEDYDYLYKLWAEEQQEIYEKQMEAEKAAMEECLDISFDYPF